MQLGMIGLGRMGGNMAKRIAAAGHEVVGYDRSPESDRTVASLKELVAALKAPRLVWVMVPAGEATDSTINELAELLQPGDMIIDGGNSRYTDDARHAAELEPKGIHFMDCGVSGGVWGIDRGYALMVGGNKDDFETARPIFEALKPEGDSGLVLAGPVGGGHFAMIAGPCSIESEEQIVGIAKAVKVAGATMLRGGAFKPRTSPYDFQGLRSEGLDLLLKARKATGLPIVTEIMSITHLPLFEDVDVIQVGARSMQNFEMLKELGRTNKPILLKRGLANTIKELLMAAEYIMASGNDQIILCERGIRTYETATRNTLDLSAVPVLHEKTHLPVVIDPSHATGVARYVPSMAAAAAACGADGLMIEVHNNPAAALCDGPQSITPEEFERVVKTVNAVRAAVNLHNMAAPSAVRTAEDVIRVCAS